MNRLHCISLKFYTVSILDVTVLNMILCQLLSTHPAYGLFIPFHTVPFPYFTFCMSFHTRGDDEESVSLGAVAAGLVRRGQRLKWLA